MGSSNVESPYFRPGMPNNSDTDFLIQALPLLLHDHDCLVIPGLGGFVAHPVPARFDGDKGEWVPPGRNVVFNPKLTVRDGLLEQEIRRATNCTTDAATALIDKEATSLKAHLESGETREIPGLGRLYQMDNGGFGFAPESRLGERYAPPGLSRIPWADHSATNEDSETSSQAANPVVPTAEADPAELASADHWSSAWVRMAAVLMLPLLVAGSLWWGQSEGDQFEFLSLNNTPPSTYLPRIEGEDIRFPEPTAGDALAFIVPGAPTIETGENSEALMPLPVPQPLSSGCNHHVIAGTFSSMQRAAGLARRFESLGYATSILPGPHGSHRVSTGCFDNVSRAAAFQKSLKGHHGIDQAWVLHL